MERPAVTHAAPPDPVEHASGHLLGVAGRKRVQRVCVFENFLRQGSDKETWNKGRFWCALLTQNTL